MADASGRSVRGLRSPAGVVVPTLGPGPRLDRCLDSLHRQDLPFVRVVVVGDGADHRLIDAVRGAAGEVILLPRRRGFAAAVNAGVRRVFENISTRTVAVINDDVRLDPGWHRAAGAALDGRPEAGACATVVLQTAAPDRIDSAGIEWTEEALADNRGFGTQPPAPDGEVVSVFGASAAAALYRREMLEDVGLFDESFAAYQEDVELALRARLAGWAAVLAPAARSVHDGFGSNRPFPGGGTRADFYNARNRLSLLMTTVPTDQWRRAWRRILSAHLAALLRALPEGRAAAAWLGAAHAIARAPFSIRRRRRNLGRTATDGGS